MGQSTVLSVCVVLLFGCGSQPPPPPPAPPEPPTSYTQPGQFTRELCVAGSVRGLGPEPSGHWQVDLEIGGFTRISTALRLLGDRALFNGRQAKVRFTADDLFVLAEYSLGEDQVTWALDGCASSNEDEVTGQTARCVNGEGCLLGTFRALRIGRRDGEAEASGLVRLAQVSIFPRSPAEAITANVRVRDDLAYLARFQDGLRIVDLANLAQPTLVGHFAPREEDAGEIYNDIKLHDHYALLASSREGMVVIDVADPSAPRFVTTFPPRLPTQARVNVHSIYVAGSRAYLADISLGGLRVVDLTNPEEPSTIGTFVLPDAVSRSDYFVHDLTVDGDLAYLNYWGAGLVVVDLSQTPFTQVGRFNYPGATSHASWIMEADGRKYALEGSEGFGAHLRIIDVTSPDDPKWMTLVGEFQTREQVSIHNIMTVGSRAYIAYYQDGLRVLDLADPSQPRQVAYHNTWDPLRHQGYNFFEGAIGLDVDPARRRVYLADTELGLFVLEEPSP